MAILPFPHSWNVLGLFIQPTIAYFSSGCLLEIRDLQEISIRGSKPYFQRMYHKVPFIDINP